jgi:hypothetical protein
MKKSFDTVGDLLAQDEVGKIVDSFNNKPSKEVLIIYTDDLDDVNFICTDMSNEHMLWLLEVIKMQLLTGDTDEENNEG